DFAGQLLPKSRYNSLVVKHRSCQNYLSAELPMTDHFGQIVFGNGTSQASHYYLNRCAGLLSGDHGLTHKGGTTCAEVNGVICSEGQICKVTVNHTNPQHFSKFFDETAGSRCAGFVHLIIYDHAVSFYDQLRILPANFDNI